MITLKLIPENRHEGLLDIVCAVRSTARGSSDRDHAEQAANLDLLKQVIAGWEPSATEEDEEWDKAVLALVTIAVSEAERVL
jgi:hypothetical protein